MPLAHDVVGQAAKGLGADDPVIPTFDELHHLRREVPALPIFTPLLRMRSPFSRIWRKEGVWNWGNPPGPGQGRLKPPDHPAQEHADLLGEAAAAVELPVHRRAGQAVPQEPQHAGEHVLTVLILEELLQLVVGEGEYFT